ncbi:MAG: carboxypeptidase M32 [Haloferacaceae archaeon]
MTSTPEAEADGTEAPEAYRDLVDRVRRIGNVGNAAGLLSWDQQVMMPEEGTPARSGQLSALSAVKHDLVTDDELGDLLDAVEGDVGGERAALVREVRRDRERAVRVPTDLIERISATSSEALPAWREAKAEADFDAFAPHLRELVDLKREYAEHVDPDRDPYEVLFEEYEPCLPLDHAESILAELRETISPLVDEIRATEADLADPFDGTYEEDAQEAMVRDALDLLGYPWERGRLDTAPHPFSMGTVYDARITTRFDESNPLDALSSTIHEFGHATYTLGLPEEHYATPLGEARDLSVHESQSRLWENHVGRSRAFLERFLPTMRDRLGVDAGVDAVYEAANQVHEDNVIRVEADELTYHLHIVLRFEIERDLVRGDLDVDEVPAVWNEKMDEYLGVVPDDDGEGCLQDVHWAHGNFGYFPTYSLGSAMAAQLYDAAERDVDGLESSVREGDVDPLKSWLRESVHRHGKRYETNELVRRATGEDFTADAFTDYVTGKFGALYGL